MEYVRVLCRSGDACNISYQHLRRNHPRIFASKARISLKATDPGVWSRLDWLLSELERICSLSELRTLEYLRLARDGLLPALEISFAKKLPAVAETCVANAVTQFLRAYALACGRCGESMHRWPQPGKLNLCRKCRDGQITADFAACRYKWRQSRQHAWRFSISKLL